MKTNKGILSLTEAKTFNNAEDEARYWREKYQLSTRHLMVAVKEWGKLRQQIEEYRSKVA
jgi:hypothetical protein